MVLQPGSGSLDIMGTFRTVAPVTDDSDDDSVVGSEMKKKVGINEHLNAALVSLSANPSSPAAGVDTSMSATGSIAGDESRPVLSHLGQTTSGGRPMSNLELTNGCAPLFACDDPSLPFESDLGIYETKEEQVRSLEVRHSQVIVEKYAVPDIFGTLACPSPAFSPDDNHSWNTRAVPARRSAGVYSFSGGQAVGSGVLPDPESPKPQHRSELTLPPTPRKTPDSTPVRTKKAFGWGSNARTGWWNTQIGDEKEEEAESESMGDLGREGSSPPLHLSPLGHKSSLPMVGTGLSPSPKHLREANLPLSHLHSATSVASTLPFLSDRPPSWRYLQIDTKAIGFQCFDEEVEPLFCSLAIYHVETMAHVNSKSSAPAPNLSKCGRVTELLNFDVVTNEDVEKRCSGVLWPYLSDGERNPGQVIPEARRTQGTRCGVFPIPSRLNVANLYAVLIVQKVLAEDSGVEIYLGGEAGDGSVPQKSRAWDMEKLRSRAAQASDRHGRLLTPFAFGVAPLLQVFGTDVPSVPTSRAVQIPLFRLLPGQGERPIIDHIMVMLYPR